MKACTKQYLSLCLLGLVLGQTFALPQHPVYQPAEITGRKFAEKPNAVKKVPSEQETLDDVSINNSLQKNDDPQYTFPGALSWIMTLLLGPTRGINPSKNEIDDSPVSPWTQIISLGLKVLTMFLGGTAPQPDGIDKVDNQSSSPMQQFINIVINLLDALKTSFSQRSIHARSLGKKDPVSEAVAAFLTMLKGLTRSMKSYQINDYPNDDDQKSCYQRIMCEASAECTTDSQGASSLFCQIGSYATSYYLQKRTGVNFETLYDAGRRGRSGENCRTIFNDCNDV